LGIVVPEQKQTINGRCLKCGYRPAWGVGSWKIVGGAKPTTFQRPSIRPQTIIEWNASRSDEVKNH